MLAKHSKSFSLIDCVSVGVDRMQRNFEPMRKQAIEVPPLECPGRRRGITCTARAGVLGSFEFAFHKSFVDHKVEAWQRSELTDVTAKVSQLFRP